MATPRAVLAFLAVLLLTGPLASPVFAQEPSPPEGSPTPPPAEPSPTPPPPEPSPPPAPPTAPNPTPGIPFAIVDRTAPVLLLDHDGATYNGSAVTAPGEGVRANGTYDLTVTGLDAAVGTTWRLHRPAADGDDTPYGNPASAYDDLAHPGRVNVTFVAVTLDVAGLWGVLSSDNATTEQTVFGVGPAHDLQVTATPPHQTYQTGATVVELLVTSVAPGSEGAPVAGASLSAPFLPAGVTTGADGRYVFFGHLPGAGVHNVEATADAAADPTPDRYGGTAIRVLPAPLGVGREGPMVFPGSNESGVWRVVYGDGAGVFEHANGTLDRPFTWANLHVARPDGAVVTAVFASESFPWPCPFGPWAPDASSAIVLDAPDCSPVEDAVLAFDGETGDVSFRPGASWENGTYHFQLGVDVEGGAVSDPEWSVGWSFTPGQTGPTPPPPPPASREGPAPFSLDITARVGARADSAGFGAHQDATSGYDAGLDVQEPPEPLDPVHVRAYFQGTAPDVPLHRSMRERSTSLQWQLVVEWSNLAGPAFLNWSPGSLAHLNGSFNVEIWDETTYADMRSTSFLSFETDGSSGARTFFVDLFEGADLRFDESAFSVPETIRQGGSLPVAGAIVNAGPLDASNVLVRLIVDGAFHGTYFVTSTLPADETFVFFIDFPLFAAPGPHTLRLTTFSETPDGSFWNNRIERGFFVVHNAVDIAPDGIGVTLSPGEALNTTVTVRNVGNTVDTFDLAVEDLPAGWSLTGWGGNVTLDAGAEAALPVRLEAPADWTSHRAVFQAELRAVSRADPAGQDATPLMATLVATTQLSLREGWSLVSLPVIPSNASFDALFPDAEVAYAWDGAGYVAAETLEPGRGYWVHSLAANAAWVTGVPVVDWTVSLLPGWNLVGGPAGAYDLSQAPANVSRSAFAWGDEGYVERPSLLGGEGAWLHVDGGDAQQVQFAPPVAATLAGPTLFDPEGLDASFRIPVRVATATRADAVAVGVETGARDAYDAAFDAYEPPTSADAERVSAYVRAGDLSRLHRSVLAPGAEMAWTLVVETSGAGGLVTLSWSAEDVAGLDPSYSVELVDGPVRIDMRAGTGYQFLAPSGDATHAFVVHVMKRDAGAVCVLRVEQECVGSPTDPVSPLRRYLP